MGKAVILMATYNGEKYIGQQIESIIGQSFQNWELYISDDCSTDRTREILMEYQKREPRICEIIVNEGMHGAFNNYYSIMRHLKKSQKEFEYVFYCDQDDVWLSDKMERQINDLKKCDFTKPALCCSNLQLADGNLNQLGVNIDKYSDINPRNKYNVFFKNKYVWGTTIAHNKALWDMLIIPEDINNDISHDSYLSKYAAAYGEIIYDEIPTVIYRRHGNNVSDLPKRNMSLMNAYWYYRAVCYTTLYFIHRAPFRTEFMNDYEASILVGGIKTYRFIKKYQINITENIFSKLVFWIVFLSGQIKREYRIKNRDYLYEKK